MAPRLRDRTRALVDMMSEPSDANVFGGGGSSSLQLSEAEGDEAEAARRRADDRDDDDERQAALEEEPATEEEAEATAQTASVLSALFAGAAGDASLPVVAAAFGSPREFAAQVREVGAHLELSRQAVDEALRRQESARHNATSNATRSIGVEAPPQDERGDEHPAIAALLQVGEHLPHRRYHSLLGSGDLTAVDSSVEQHPADGQGGGAPSAATTKALFAHLSRGSSGGAARHQDVASVLRGIQQVTGVSSVPDEVKHMLHLSADTSYVPSAIMPTGTATTPPHRTASSTALLTTTSSSTSASTSAASSASPPRRSTALSTALATPARSTSSKSSKEPCPGEGEEINTAPYSAKPPPTVSKGGYASVSDDDLCRPGTPQSCRDSLAELWVDERREGPPQPPSCSECVAGRTCNPPICLVLTPADECPAFRNLPNCRRGPRGLGMEIGDLCEGDGECGTSGAANNCGYWDMYRRVECYATPEQMTHIEFWLRGLLGEARYMLEQARKLRQKAATLRDTGTANTVGAADYDLRYVAAASYDNSAAVALHVRPLTSLTVTMWVKVPHPDLPATLFTLTGAEAPNFLALSDPGTLSLATQGRRNQHGLTHPNVALAKDEWQHVAVTWEGKHGQYTIYVNGLAVATGVLGVGSATPRDGKLVLGQMVDADSGGFVQGRALLGTFSNVNLFSGVLSPRQIGLTFGFVGDELSLSTLASMGRGGKQTLGAIRRWADFRLGIVGPSVSEVVPSQSPTMAEIEALKSSDYDAIFGPPPGGAMAAIGFNALPAFSICAWLRCEAGASPSFGETAASYAVAGEMDAFALRANLDFVLHGHLHSLRKARACGDWRHFCLAHPVSGEWKAYVDGKQAGAGINTRGGLPGGGALIAGQLQRSLGMSFSKGVSYHGALSGVGVYSYALDEAGVRSAHDGAIRGDAKPWRKFRVKATGDVTIVEPSTVRTGQAAPARSRSRAKANQFVPWSFDSGP